MCKWASGTTSYKVLNKVTETILQSDLPHPFYTPNKTCIIAVHYNFRQCIIWQTAQNSYNTENVAPHLQGLGQNHEQIVWNEQNREGWNHS